MPADSASVIVKFTISIPGELCTNVKAKYSSSVVPPDPSVHFYHWVSVTILVYDCISVRNCSFTLKFEEQIIEFA